MEPSLRARLSPTIRAYPGQFWLMFWGLLVSRIGTSMIWPFLVIYVSEQVDLPLAAVASLLTVNAVASIAASFLAGPAVDRIGRKWIMVGGLASHSLVYLLLGQAETLPVFAALLALSGAIAPLYTVGSDAMVADLVPSSKRIDAYALMRLSANVGIAIGPLIGGLLVTTSYQLAFYMAAAGLLIFSLLILFFGRETLPKVIPPEDGEPTRQESFGGYGEILGDRSFMAFLLLVSLGILPGILMWTLMPVYAKENYALSEARYGLLPTTNALMVVFLQLPVTKMTAHYPSRRVMALGALFYSLGGGLVALARGFAGFWISMVVMSLGELVLMPTSTSYAANLAPENKRGRYMSLYNLTWPAAMAVGPVFGGLLNDRIGPWAIWLGGLLVGLVGAAGLLLLPSGRAEGASEQREDAPQITG